MDEVLRLRRRFKGDSRGGVLRDGEVWEVARTGEAGVGAGIGAGAVAEDVPPLFRLFFLFLDMKEGIVGVKGE